jgi:hypothetical protein
MIAKLVVIHTRYILHAVHYQLDVIYTPTTPAQVQCLALMFNLVMAPIIKQMLAVKSLTFTTQDVDINS